MAELHLEEVDFVMTSVFPSYYITQACAQEPEPHIEPHDFCGKNSVSPETERKNRWLARA